LYLCLKKAATRLEPFQKGKTGRSIAILQGAADSIRSTCALGSFGHSTSLPEQSQSSGMCSGVHVVAELLMVAEMRFIRTTIAGCEWPVVGQSGDRISVVEASWYRVSRYFRGSVIPGFKS
jgi:hypothetical protein